MRNNSEDVAPARPVSDHFDGKRFFNPTLPGGFAPTLATVLKMLREHRSRWPCSVENEGVSQLDAKLAIDDIAVTFVGGSGTPSRLAFLLPPATRGWSGRSAFATCANWTGGTKRQPATG